MSFAGYHASDHMGFRGLGVINEDRVQPGERFGPHPHRDMEIISYVLEGGLQHRDSMGNGSVIRPDDVQRMSAGTGVTHSEFNASGEELVHFPPDLAPPVASRPRARLRAGDVSASREAGEDPGDRVARRPRRKRDDSHRRDPPRGVVRQGRALPRGRHGWVQAARGTARVNGHEMKAGDGAALSDEPTVHIEGIDASEVLVFDLA